NLTSTYIPRTPTRPPLIPYTTLFRSAVAAHVAADRGDRVGEELGQDLALILHRQQVLPCGHQPGHEAGAGEQGRHQHARLGEEADRKSTRLNSSHVKISYAVFCLKKK